ncbi:hypothetical protein FAZ15_20370 [Sphingobacterium olei]|uniref:Molybdopterin molybdenumtransferase n=1 Tax=Sphingobacterium olei TaxID=2571155 RepID=A0A4U0NN58_9SPHI|nr:gephyrin-like molybdotransferase Glp [Sphingobacterium olei]TJZ51474.1 hypothetical protein FAZ15_20370 [Sphingobacterium olei]
MKDTGIIILAAGSSSRLGTAKQLLEYQGKTLLMHVVEQALASQPARVVVVVGAHAEEITATLAGKDVAVCYNTDWSTGMASSINRGITQLLIENPGVKSCIFSVCDQPYISEENFTQLFVRQSEIGKGIVASTYADTVGVPVLFSKSYFEMLLTLHGDQGAKKIVEQHNDDLATIPFDLGGVDIDRPKDLNHLWHQMVSVSVAREIIKNNCTNGSKGIRNIRNAGGYTVAESIVSNLDIPHFRQSAMDGYAIKFEDRLKTLNVVGEMRAGQPFVEKLISGNAIRIFTGAPLPEDADTVVMQEKVKRDGDWITITDDHLAMGSNVRQKGSEAQKGTLALAAGTLMTPAAIGFLAGIGCQEVLIFEPPKIAIILTGDELQELGKPLSFGQVYESNSLQLHAALKKAGVVAVNVYHSQDDPDKLKAVLAEALQESDMVLLVGGVSVGEYDFVVQTALREGVQPHFHKVKQKPGKPLFFGTKEGKMVFGLPGNPSSALTCLYLYVLPAIDQIMQRPDSLTTISAITTADYSKNVGLTYFIKAHLKDGKVSPLHAQESYRLQSYAQANCLLVLEEASAGAKVGDVVQVILLS